MQLVSIVGSRQILENHLDGLQSQRIGVRTVQGGNISLDGVGQSVHTGVSNLFYRKTHNQIRINDSYIRGDVEVSQRILDTSAVICDNGEGSYFGSSTGSRGIAANLAFCLSSGKPKGVMRSSNLISGYS